MTSLIVTGHGSFASSLVETAEMIVGSTAVVHAVDFPVGTGVDDLTARMQALIDRLTGDNPEDGVVILADVLGGSPARVALGEAMAGRAEVVTGANLPMVIDLALAPAGSSATELAERAVENGRAGIRDAGAQLREGATS